MQVSKARAQYVRWLLAGRDLSPHTIRAYESDIAAFDHHLGLWAGVREINRESVIAFVEAQQRRGLSARSVRRRVSALRGFCRWLVEQGILDTDPWTGVHVSAGRARTLPRAIERKDLDRLLQSLRRAADLEGGSRAEGVLGRPHEATTLLAVALMVATGVRVQEAVGIDHRHVDVAAGSLRLVGKGRRERHVFLPNEWIRDLMVAYLTMREALEVGHPTLLFNRRREPLTPAAMRLRLRNAARDAGLKSRVTPHMLRHTAATQLIEAGVDIRYIQRLLGHASLTTTEIYTHVSNQALKRVVEDADVLGGLVNTR